MRNARTRSGDVGARNDQHYAGTQTVRPPPAYRFLRNSGACVQPTLRKSLHPRATRRLPVARTWAGVRSVTRGAGPPGTDSPMPLVAAQSGAKTTNARRIRSHTRSPGRALRWLRGAWTAAPLPTPSITPYNANPFGRPINSSAPAGRSNACPRTTRPGTPSARATCRPSTSRAPRAGLCFYAASMTTRARARAESKPH